MTARDPKDAAPIAVAETVSYDGATLVTDIKNTLSKRNSLSIRGLAQVFKQMDANRNRKVDVAELEGGLRLIGINLNDDQCGALLKFFDKDNSGCINFNEFLVCIRVSSNKFIL